MLQNLPNSLVAAAGQHRQRQVAMIPGLDQLLRVDPSKLDDLVVETQVILREITGASRGLPDHKHRLPERALEVALDQQPILQHPIGHREIASALELDMKHGAIGEGNQQIHSPLLDARQFHVRKPSHANTAAQPPQQRGAVPLEQFFQRGIKVERFRHGRLSYQGNRTSREYRQIFRDGRALPKDPNPTFMGYSVGHWEGDTLVVESTGYNERTWLEAGYPHTENLRITERWQRKDFGHMSIDASLSDPAIYAKPWTVNAGGSYTADTDLLEFVCAENEKDR